MGQSKLKERGEQRRPQIQSWTWKSPIRRCPDKGGRAFQGEGEQRQSSKAGCGLQELTACHSAMHSRENVRTPEGMAAR